MADRVWRWFGLAGAVLCLLGVFNTIKLPDLRVESRGEALIGVMNDHLREFASGLGPFLFVLFRDQAGMLISVAFAVTLTVGVREVWSRWAGAGWLALVALVTAFTGWWYGREQIESEYFGYWDDVQQLMIWLGALLLVVAVVLAAGRYLLHDMLAALLLFALGTGHLLMLALSSSFLAEDAYLRTEIHPQAWIPGPLLIGAGVFVIIAALASARLREPSELLTAV